MYRCSNESNKILAPYPFQGISFSVLINQIKQIIGLNQEALNKDTLLSYSNWDTWFASAPDISLGSRTLLKEIGDGITSGLG